MAQGTRGRQQEEQMATVIAVLREQGEKQERVAEEQRVRHEGLSAQFREQVEQLAHTQQRSWDMQQELERRMVNLEGKLRATRETASGLLEVAEVTLQGVVNMERREASALPLPRDATTGTTHEGTGGAEVVMLSEEGRRVPLAPTTTQEQLSGRQISMGK